MIPGMEKRFVATCAFGLEALVGDEVAAFGGTDVTPAAGSVAFSGSLETAYRLCLWSRFSTRVLLPLQSFSAPDPDALYREAAQVDWDDHFGPDATFLVESAARRSPIRNTHFAELRVKDAVVDQFRERYNFRPSIDTTHPDIRIHLFLDGEGATLSLDLSGESLHRRGYRGASGGEAPLKESLAAAILAHGGWPGDFLVENGLVDPMCGSGTLLIEAALMVGDMAPGLGRTSYGFLTWRHHDQALWTRLLEEAKTRRDQGLSKPWPAILGYDASQTAVDLALGNIKRAGLKEKVLVGRRDLAFLKPPGREPSLEGQPHGLLVVNPPYGERLDAHDALPYLYRCLGRTLKQQFDQWRKAVFTANPALLGTWEMAPARKVRLFNGPIPCELVLYEPEPRSEGTIEISRLPRGRVTTGTVVSEFANRLRKNLRRLSGWAKREGVSCFRLYDADIPQYNVAVDLYEGRVSVSEYAAPKTVDPAEASRRLKEIMAAIQDLMRVGPKAIYLRVRQRQTGRRQYQKRDSKERLHEVGEGPCRFLVNLTDYLDTGLFLDHRTIRQIIRERSGNIRFLNLFSYTGTATVHAAMGGAEATVSVDASDKYLGWSRKNLALNGFSEERHTLITMDVMDWLYTSKDRFDLIFADPPTFSNSKDRRRNFMVQRDHPELIRLAMGHLNKNGLVIFSTHFQRFNLDPRVSAFQVEEITRKTIPPDFKQRPDIHRSWLIRQQPNLSQRRQERKEPTVQVKTKTP
jgi:23S rRNA (guanine2445-N2)-methyltransferase / 23S rRNA (guanine2069-N7)-methyltransferase